MAGRQSQGAREILLKEVTSKLRPGGKEKLVRQRKEEATVVHTQEVLSPGVEVRSGIRQGWKVGREAYGGSIVSVALRSLDSLWREIRNQRVLRRVHSEKSL